MWYVLYGNRGLCIFCSQNREEVKNYGENMVANTYICIRRREFERGERVYKECLS